MPKQYRVAAVVVTYNRKELLRECMEALLAQELPENISLELLVVDNAGTDGSREFVADLLQRNTNIHYVRLKRNMGGAGGFYHGMKRAAEAGYDAVWIMDDDTIPHADALRHLLEGMKRIRKIPGYLSSQVQWTDGSTCKMNQQHFLKPAEGAQTELARTYGIRPIDQATFVSLLFPAETIRKVGLPIKEYFIWGDDKEYTLRIAAEFPCYYIPDSVVVHKMGKNTGSNITYDEIERIPRYFYAYRNDFATARRRGIRDVAVYLAAFGLNLCRILLHSPDHKRERIGIMWKGFAAGLRFSPEISFAAEPKRADGEDI